MRRIEAITICDFCGARGNSGWLSVNWSEDAEVLDTTELSWTTGDNYSDCLDIVTKYVDMCGNCFRDKLLPWMLEQGVKPQIKEGL